MRQYPKRIYDTEQGFRPHGKEFYVYQWITFANGWRVWELVCICDWLDQEDLKFEVWKSLDDLLLTVANQYGIPVKDLVVRYG